MIFWKKSVFLTFWEFPESLDPFRKYYHKTRVGKSHTRKENEGDKGKLSVRVLNRKLWRIFNVAL